MTTDLILMLAVGTMISCGFSLFMGDDAIGFIIRLVFTCAIQVLIWYILGTR